MQKNSVYELRKTRKGVEVSCDTNSCNEQDTCMNKYQKKSVDRHVNDITVND
jgi:hypothetical protein